MPIQQFRPRKEEAIQHMPRGALTEENKEIL